MSVSVNDVFPGGAILKRTYGRRAFSLHLWHYAFNEGHDVELVRVKREDALDLAFEHWAGKLRKGYLPPQIVDSKGRIWERQWKSLSLGQNDEEVSI